jgi:hypothetical protein
MQQYQSSYMSMWPTSPSKYLPASKLTVAQHS